MPSNWRTIWTDEQGDLTRIPKRSLDEASSSASTGSGIRPQCYPILSRYTTVFKEMVHQGTELKKRKKINPTPKRPEDEFTHYRDITRQNQWLRANVFDGVENYMYCFNCITRGFRKIDSQDNAISSVKNPKIQSYK